MDSHSSIKFDIIVRLIASEKTFYGRPRHDFSSAGTDKQSKQCASYFFMQRRSQVQLHRTKETHNGTYNKRQHIQYS